MSHHFFSELKNLFVLVILHWLCFPDLWSFLVFSQPSESESLVSQTQKWICCVSLHCSSPEESRIIQVSSIACSCSYQQDDDSFCCFSLLQIQHVIHCKTYVPLCKLLFSIYATDSCSEWLLPFFCCLFFPGCSTLDLLSFICFFLMNSPVFRILLNTIYVLLQCLQFYLW